MKQINRISTDYRNMLQWTKFIDLNKIQTVLDLTGGAGCESIFFAKLKQIKKVISYEIDQERFQLFQQNIKQLTPKEQQKITLLNKDSTSSFGTKCDLILFDPPWTFSKEEDYMQGKREQFSLFQEQILKEYNNTKILSSKKQIPLQTVDLKLGKYNVQQVINNCEHYCNIIALKIPLNCVQSPYSRDYIPLIQQHSIIPIIYQKKIKYLVIIINCEKKK